MRGRKPNPTARQIADGDTRKIGKRKLRQKLAAEPKAAAGLPSCPRHLRGRARAAWGFWSEELAAMNLDRRPDAMMLEGACVGYQRAVAADLIVGKEGLTVETRAGQLKAHPAVRISQTAWAQVRAFASEFGLSPVSRTRLAIEKKDDGEADLMTLLTQRREKRPSVN